VRISVIIPTLNNEETLPKILRSVMSSPVEKEVIVVDGGSKDATVRIAREFGCRVLMEEGKEKSPANAKNQGAKVAQGDVLVFLEGDLDHLSEDFFQQIEEAFRKGADACTWENELVEDTLPEKLHDRFVRLNLWMMRKEQPNLVMAVKREIFERVGGVPLVGYGEDAAFDEKVRQVTSKIVNTSAISYYHKVHTFSRLFNQAKWVGRTASSARTDILYGGLFFCLLSPFLLLLSTLFLLPFLLYLGRYSIACAHGIKKKDAVYLLVPLVDAIYSIGYLVGRFVKLFIKRR